MELPSRRSSLVGVDIKRKSIHNNNLNLLNNEYGIVGSYKSSISLRRQSTAKLAVSPLNVQNSENDIPSSLPSSIGSKFSQIHQHLVDPENPTFVSKTKEDQIISEHTMNKYVNDSLCSEGGDITHNLKMQNNKFLKPSRRKSATDLISEFERRGSNASGINVPGGFRREFIVNKQRKLAILNDDELKQIPFFTKNFMEFLYIYGHFAGETFDEDFDLFNDDEQTPLLEITPTKYEAKGTTSTSKAFFIMLKAFIGTGILFLPKAFDNGGLLFSILALTIFGIYSFYCYYILVSAKTSTMVSSFGDIGFKLYGEGMRNLILVSLVLTQVGFTCAYIIFTSENLSAFLKNIFNWDLDQFYIYFFQALLFIPLSFIRNVSKLSLPAFLANFFIFIGLIIVLIFSSLEIFQNGIKSSVEFVINKSKFSIFIGTAIFAFEGIGLIIPIQDSMKHPEKFPLVLGLVIMTISLLMMIIAVTGYLAYGADIQTVILLNLPQSNIAVQLIQFFYSCAILLSIPLQIFPAIAIIEKKILFPSSSGKNNSTIKWSKNFFRSIFVIICVLISWYGAANLDKFVSFVGCFACIPLVYMYPPMFHLKTNPETKGYDYLLLIIGFIAMIYTSYQIIFETA